MHHRKQVADVFGVSNTVLIDSYVDRGALDEDLKNHLKRTTHIALRGESKCGKSWLRQTVLPDAMVVQCRIGKTTMDIYRDALSQLQVRLEIDGSSSTAWKGRVEAQGELGIKLLARLGVRSAIEAEQSQGSKTTLVGHDITDLRFIANLLKASGRRLVIEDFHYLSTDQRRAFAFDLKALWDYGVFVIIVGVWSEQNLLLFLNPDLTGRVREVPIVWNRTDLSAIFRHGGSALNVAFAPSIEEELIADCFENAGILQRLILGTLDELGIREGPSEKLTISDVGAFQSAAMAYAEELNALYQLFAKRISNGVRSYPNSTGIYAHAMAAIMNEPDDVLIKGLSIDRIYAVAAAREPRIQKGNLHKALEKFEGLQVDPDGRGLVLSYNEADREISVVDRQLLLYRKYVTVKWPWEDMIAQYSTDSSFQSDSV